MVWHVVDWPQVVASLLRAEPGWLLVAFVSVQVQVILSAERWRLTAERLGVRIERMHAVGEYYLASLLNQLLPGGVAGDLVRVARNSKHGTSLVAPTSTVSLTRMAQSVIVERLAGQLALLALLVSGMLIWPLLTGQPIPATGWFVVLLVCGSTALAMAGGRFIARRVGGKLRQAFEQFGPDLRRCWLNDGAWCLQLPLGLLISSSYIAVFVLAGLAIGEPLPVAAWLLVVPVTLFGMLLPIGIGGWGVREAVAAALWPLAGLSAEAGVATGILYGIVSLSGCLPGALWALPRFGSRMSATKSSTSSGR